jgi:predicted AlkP superfamily pyrophosphatase or phosphodiesterase
VAGRKTTTTMKRAPATALLLLGTLLTPRADASPGPDPRVERVVLLALDGLSSEGLDRASTPHLDALAARGALLRRSMGVRPSLSAPNWASILTGVSPEVHGIDSNRWWWFRWRRHLSHPTLFTALKRSGQRHRTVAAIHEWAHFGKLFDPADVDRAAWSRSPRETVERVARVLDDPPRLAVVHLLGVDDAGHEHGWQSRAYLDAVTRVDAQVGELLALLDARGLRASTLVAVASDHGGVGLEHGGDSATERMTPVILQGPTVRAGVVVERSTSNVDLFATLARALGLPPATRGSGEVLHELFDGTP